MLKRIVSAILCVMLSLTTTVVCFADSPSYSAQAAVDHEAPYYYSQLSENAKNVYTKLKTAVLECQSEVILNDIQLDEEDFKMITELLLMHDPMTFNVSDIKLKTTTRISGYSRRISLAFEFKYDYNRETYDKMVSAYEKKVDNILSKLTDDMSTYKKIRVIHDEIIKNTVYDLESPTNSTIYGALVKNKAKCDGYAKTFSYICAKAGIQTVTVLGNASRDNSTEYHMWNKVYYNQKWYNVDVTWDDPIVNWKDNYTHEYFMISDAAIGKSHSEENITFEAPKAFDDSINYYKVNKKYADSLSSAKTLITNGLTSAAKNQTTYYEFQCSSKSVYNEVKKYFENSGNIGSILKKVKKNSGKKIATNIYSYTANDNLYTIKILVFYEETSIANYYPDTDSIDSDALKVLAKLGIK